MKRMIPLTLVALLAGCGPGEGPGLNGNGGPGSGSTDQYISADCWRFFDCAPNGDCDYSSIYISEHDKIIPGAATYSGDRIEVEKVDDDMHDLWDRGTYLLNNSYQGAAETGGREAWHDQCSSSNGGTYWDHMLEIKEDYPGSVWFRFENESAEQDPGIDDTGKRYGLLVKTSSYTWSEETCSDQDFSMYSNFRCGGM